MKKYRKLFSFSLSALITMTTLPSHATISTAQIMASSASPQCADYKVVGICYWLFCTNFGCKIRTSTKVRHFLPEQVVSGYNHEGQNPWSEVSGLGNGIKGGSYQDKPATKQYSQMVFKNVDVIGHPQGAISQFLGNTGYYCRSQSYAFQPHFLSGMDVMGWRFGVPEMFYPEAITPGMREMGKNGDTWGNIYPRAGSITQIHPYKAAAVKCSTLKQKKCVLSFRTAVLLMPIQVKIQYSKILHGRFGDLTLVVSLVACIYTVLIGSRSNHNENKSTISSYRGWNHDN